MFSGLFSEVQWTLGYVGLLLYVFAIVTYRAPIATPAIVMALAGVFLSGVRIRVPAFLIVFAAFIGWGYIGYTQSVFPGAVREQLILLTKLWVIAFAAVNTLRTKAQVRFFLVFFLVCFATHPARGAIFNYFYGYTVFGRALWNNIYGNPNDLAGLTLFPLALGISLMKDHNVWVRRGAIVSVIALSILILMTQSRGGFLALVLMVLLVLQTQRRKLRALVAIAALAGVVVAIAPTGVWERVSVLMSDGTEADTSSRQRWEIWQVAGEISANHPVLGVGLGAYSLAHQQQVLLNPEYTLAGGARDAHGTYVSIRAEAGWPGVLLFLLMILIPLKQAIAARRRLAHSPAESGAIAAVAVALVGFIAAGVFATYAYLAFLYLHMAVLTVLCTAAQPQPARAATRARRPLRPGPTDMPPAVRPQFQG
jgi:O-antigen ligase